MTSSGDHDGDIARCLQRTAHPPCIIIDHASTARRKRRRNQTHRPSPSLIWSCYLCRSGTLVQPSNTLSTFSSGCLCFKYLYFDTVAATVPQSIAGSHSVSGLSPIRFLLVRQIASPGHHGSIGHVVGIIVGIVARSTDTHHFQPKP
jgi:hypothetical protein